MNKEIGNVAGVSIMVSPETYEDIKKQKTIYENEILFELQNRIDKAIKLLDSYKLGKYDYALTPAGLLELEDILRGKDIKETPKLIGDTPKEDKKIEKLEQKYLNANYVELVDKINEIIDKVNKL